MIAGTWIASASITCASLALKAINILAWSAIVSGLFVFIAYMFIIRKMKKTSSRVNSRRVQRNRVRERKASGPSIIRERSVIASSLFASVSLLGFSYPWAVLTLVRQYSFGTWMVKNCLLILKPAVDSIQYFLASKWRRLLR